MLKLPTREATLAHVKRGSSVLIHGKWQQVGRRPRPGFVRVGNRYCRLSTKVQVLDSGKVMQH